MRAQSEKAVLSGQHHVEDGEVEFLLVDGFGRLAAVVESGDGVALVFQIQPHQLGDLLLVVHQ